MSAAEENAHPHTGALAVVANAVAANAAAAANSTDPARRPDVLFRVRREEGHQPSAWWAVGAFVGVSAIVLMLLSFVPGGA